MSLILLRHTRPAVAEGICYGRTDLGLAACFSAEAARLVRTLPPVAAVATSPLTRCRWLAEAIAQARGLPLTVAPGLVEIDFGRWEGVAWSAIPRPEIDAWAADLLHARPHGGETVAELSARVAAALEGLRGRPRPLLAVTHAGVIKAARGLLGGQPDWHGSLAFGAWERFEPA